MKQKWLVFLLILSLGGTFSFSTKAFDVKEDFPRLANYYLQPLILKGCYDDLAKYDLLILDVDVQTINTKIFSQIEKDNSNIKFFAYIPSQSVNVQDLSSWARLRKINYEKVNNEDWWLKDSSGEIINLSNIWPTIKFVDLGDEWVDYLSDLVKEDIVDRNVWDGIFYDMVFVDIGWLNDGDIDINGDGQKDNIDLINKYWKEQMQELLNQTKSKIGFIPLIINLAKINSYENESDGLMMENFPSPHLTGNNWTDMIEYYLNDLPLKNKSSQIVIINANTDNRGRMSSYQEMRFGLTSTLLGNGYYSFDSGDQSHGQVWWYDEYDVGLGKAVSAPYNLLELDNQKVKPGLWRRDFEQGIILVNSTGQKQNYFFNNEEFETINGTQDRRVNNGIKTNLIKLESNDGIVLLKANKEIRNNSFNNGNFVRVFNKDGKQSQNGFFVFKDNFQGNTEILLTDLDNDNSDETLIADNQNILIYKDNQKIKEIKAYDFNGNTSLSVGDFNRDYLKEIVSSAGIGNVPHVKVFNQQGELLSEFMAYDENFRGGVNVAVGDINNNGIEEIVTGTGFGGGPHVKVFNQQGELLNEFMAYDENFRGGVNVAVGDINNDDYDEIIVGAGPTGGPHVKVFNQQGELLSEFMAYDENNKDGIIVMSDDLNKDGFSEILIGTSNF